MLSFRQGYPKGYVETNAFPKQCHVKEDGHRDNCSDRKGKETRVREKKKPGMRFLFDIKVKIEGSPILP